MARLSPHHLGETTAKEEWLANKRKIMNTILCIVVTCIPQQEPSSHLSRLRLNFYCVRVLTLL
ncbi:MAG: hypothetical protein ACYS6W_12470 [Planctomycetota bacterium]